MHVLPAELIFAIRTDWFVLLRINFCDFQEVPVPSIDNIFVFIEYVQQKYIFSNNDIKPEYFVVYRFVSERKRDVI